MKFIPSYTNQFNKDIKLQKNRKECHIEPDWLLIYKLDQNSIIFERTGTHADLFE
ncbi:type II toxin-antitoxin system mRNA interferase toxin, RelE/StbE family [Leptospira bandrabouensis]|uniref:Type II toxin-antitoxin system mRNA interferase toxin, RelE/StbE family n=1 Tax=Leptospira bandrabouensis TaxID=2484903 RepID=A0A6H3NW55_9LEPT|nr:type II toxin-antitoxin system mRNA interferase toxin, RelE/StbE family [Leptospira bandrabouensis]MCG6146468.1 type II toxin-antitoxin system YafQ family toxin [Leptospira bandrabouensis]MCG6154012.1 type II toxin-antitoxin system YafQ family toxin [Leptospira bandrabouensis]MCG6161615.1 type II toxin-antitoxin system YafQ family toxin [Leptospira bandrabouensis]MCG6166055.1 type II toxin-antitoxin system YafQ family toxin [Leptospira bandrabouensis]MCW7459795.1 type II toxin-antitoxin sys